MSWSSPGHDDDDEETAQKLPPEILPACPVPLKDAAQRAVAYRVPCALGAQAEVGGRAPHDAADGKQQADGLCDIRAHDGTQASRARIHIDEQ